LPRIDRGPRSESELQAALGDVAAALPFDDCQRVARSAHLPTAVAQQISATLRDARDRGLISDFVMTAIDQNVQLLVDDIGGCERIHKTPIPFAYMVHVRRALIVYCLSLPVAIAGEFGWFTVPIVFLTCYVFIGIEEIGVEIEDPFGSDENDLPLETICATIERNLVDMIPAAPPP
jgi:putative membrane protein